MAEVPEEIVLNIFSRLPVKSLIRFSSVSKRLYSVIFSDLKFAQAQLKAAARLSRRRVLVSTEAYALDSLPLDDTQSVRKLDLPLDLKSCYYLHLLGSCNGLVFVSVYEKLFYICNPTLGLSEKLPVPGFSLSDKKLLIYYGVGYLPATDDYKLVLAFKDINELQVEMFSLRSRSWERIESPCRRIVGHGLGTLSNNALHWLMSPHVDSREISCFDLEVKQFRTMQLPEFDNAVRSFSILGVCEGGCLCASRYPRYVCDSIELWVMREYGVADSWTMLFRVKVADPPRWNVFSNELLVVESGTVAAIKIKDGFELVSIDHKEDQKVGKYITKKGNRICMVEYQESLLWFGSYNRIEEPEQVLVPGNPSQGLTNMIL